MIRAWRRQFVDTYAVDATFIPSDASHVGQDGGARQPRAGGRHPGRQRPGALALRRMARRHAPHRGGDQPGRGCAAAAPTPAPNDPNCFGYAHRVPAATLPPTRKDDHLEGAQRRSTRKPHRAASRRPAELVDHWATGASTRVRGTTCRVSASAFELDTTPSHAADNSADSGELNYSPAGTTSDRRRRSDTRPGSSS